MLLLVGVVGCIGGLERGLSEWEGGKVPDVAAAAGGGGGAVEGGGAGIAAEDACGRLRPHLPQNFAVLLENTAPQPLQVTSVILN